MQEQQNEQVLSCSDLSLLCLNKVDGCSMWFRKYIESWGGLIGVWKRIQGILLQILLQSDWLQWEFGWFGFCQEDIRNILLIHPGNECENIFCARPTAVKHQKYWKGDRMLALYAFKTDYSSIFPTRISSSQQLCNDENQPTEYLLQLDFHSVY